MWNRRDMDAPATDPRTVKRDAPSTPSREFIAAPARTGAHQSEGIVNIGQSICIRGELTGDEDLTIEGKVEGKIDLKEHNLTIGPNGRIQAEVGAKSVLVRGEVTGNISAHEKIELAETGRVNGDMVAPRIVIADGARFKGSVDMSGPRAAASKGAAREKVSPAPALITDSPAADSGRGVART